MTTTLLYVILSMVANYATNKYGGDNMTNSRKLKGLIATQGYSQTQVAKKIGISPTSFNYKINNVREFRQSEIMELVELFKIKNIAEYFFAK